MRAKSGVRSGKGKTGTSFYWWWRGDLFEQYGLSVIQESADVKLRADFSPF